MLEATPEEPYLAVCIALAPDTVARTLLALADAAPSAAISAVDTRQVPGFVSLAAGKVRYRAVLQHAR